MDPGSVLGPNRSTNRKRHLYTLEIAWNTCKCVRPQPGVKRYEGPTLILICDMCHFPFADFLGPSPDAFWEAKLGEDSAKSMFSVCPLNFNA